MNEAMRQMLAARQQELSEVARNEPTASRMLRKGKAQTQALVSQIDEILRPPEAPDPLDDDDDEED